MGSEGCSTAADASAGTAVDILYNLVERTPSQGRRKTDFTANSDNT